MTSSLESTEWRDQNFEQNRNRDQIFWYWNKDFFSKTKLSKSHTCFSEIKFPETIIETFYPRWNFLYQKPILFFTKFSPSCSQSVPLERGVMKKLLSLKFNSNKGLINSLIQNKPLLSFWGIMIWAGTDGNTAVCTKARAPLPHLGTDRDRAESCFPQNQFSLAIASVQLFAEWRGPHRI